MKKLISLVLASVMIFGLAMPVAAQTNEQQRFITSLNATYQQLQREYEFANKHLDVQYEFLETLAHSAYETVVEISADFLGQTAGLNTTSRVGLANGGISSITEIFGLSDLLFTPDFSLSFYMNNDIIAIGSDLVGANYFYVERGITEAEFEASEIAQAGVLTYNELMFLLTTLQSAVNVPTLADMQLVVPEGLFDKYADVFNAHIANARFFSEGEQFVTAERGHIRTEKLTARMGPVTIASMLNDFADTLENDTELHDYLASFVPEEMQVFVAMGVGVVADGLRQAADDFTGTVDFSLYIASNGFAVRQSLDISPCNCLNYVFIVDMLGRDFLINEMGFYFIVKQYNQQVLATELTSIGNNIMRGGVSESVTTFSITADDTHVEVVMDYWWDANLTEDNFTMDFFVTVADPWTGAFDFSLYTKGTFYISAEELILELTATSPMTLELIGDAEASARFFTAMRAISADTAGITGTGINIVDLALDNPVLEQFFQLLDQSGF